MEAQRRISLQILLHFFCSFSSITINSFQRFFTAVATAFRCVMKARLKAFNLMTIWYELYARLCFDICFLAYSENQAVMLAPWHQSSSGPFFYFHRNCQDFHIVSKRSKSFRQSRSSNCFLVGACCQLFS